MRLVRAVPAALLALCSCQFVKPAPPEPRLEPVKSAVPVAPVPSYPLDPTELAPADLRAESRALEGVVSFPLEPGKLRPGRAYRLRLTASSKAPAAVAVVFREPKKNESFRTYRVAVSGEQAKTYSLELTAPAFTERAELRVEAKGGVTISQASLQERAPLPRTEPVASWAGSYVPPGYALVYNDEFSGKSLDRSKWFTRYIYSSETLDRLNDENQRYADNDNHRLAGGVLYLTARRNKLSRPSGVNYESGMIRSDFTLRYGFLEARVKMPGGLGVWPAFWLNSDVSESGKLSHPPEIDIFEFVNNGKDDRVHEIHSAVTKDPQNETRFFYEHPKFKRSIQNYRAPFNFNEGFHTIGAEWTPTEVSVFVDGLKIYTRNFRWVYKDGDLAAPAHVLLNLAIGGQWAGRYGIDDSAFPQSLAVDWVRVYQKPAGS
ncbi:MAG: glycosyl hydrolase family protein [Myxococcales bacterium]|nr:MAG: glycosyl hydrolase family protein [Myxococcales bacterium]